MLQLQGVYVVCHQLGYCGFLMYLQYFSVYGRSSGEPAAV